MISRKVLWSGIVVVLLGARTVVAAPITFTGNVANDFNPQTNPGVTIITDATHDNNPIHIAQPSWMTDSGLVSGWNIKDMRLDYNAATDTMYVGVNTYGVAGNVDGNGTPGVPDPRLTAAGRYRPGKLRRRQVDGRRFRAPDRHLQPHEPADSRDRRRHFRQQSPIRPGSRWVQRHELRAEWRFWDWQPRSGDQFRQHHRRRGWEISRSIPACSIPASSSRSPISARSLGSIPPTAWSSASKTVRSIASSPGRIPWWEPFPRRSKFRSRRPGWSGRAWPVVWPGGDTAARGGTGPEPSLA